MDVFSDAQVHKQDQDSVEWIQLYGNEKLHVLALPLVNPVTWTFTVSYVQSKESHNI